MYFSFFALYNKYDLLQPTDYGYWKFQKIDTSAWDVKVTGQSSVDFTYQFLQPGPGGFGEYPIKGRPIAGRQVKYCNQELMFC